jgi:hypothetical protein
MGEESTVTVTMTCMTTKKKFDVENPDVTVLRNGRYAYMCECPWEGKNGKKLKAFKFCSAKAYNDYVATNPKTSESEHVDEAESEQDEAPDEAESEHLDEQDEAPDAP